MKFKARWGFAALLLALPLIGAHWAVTRSWAEDPGAGRQSCTSVTAETCSLAHSLGRGVNLGNMLEAPREGDWGVKATPQMIDLAAQNFRTVRVPVRWSNHAARTADAKIDEAFARRVDEVIDRLLQRGVYVIVNVHHYNQLSGDDLHNHEFRVDPAVVETRFYNLWRQIAARYKDRPNRLIFELLNEPHSKLDGEPWNRMAAQALSIVRETNPDRPVMIGPGSWNNVNELKRLRLPDDRNLIVAVHTYEPYNFTHQGIEWRKPPLPAGIPCCDAKQKREMTETMAKARRWNRDNGVPLHLGEFGAHSKGDMAARATWARYMRDEAERYGIGWTWWEFGSDFSGVWSAETGTWVEPIRRALLD